METGGSGQVKWTSMSSKEARKPDAGPKYSRFSESLRHAAPGALQCSMFCGGKACKYENPSKFKPEEMAIHGLYSSWVTDDILATARPSSEIIRSYKVIEQFKKFGIKSIINLQHPHEHSSCGSGVNGSGFSYDPEQFMQAEIFYYNFNWNDYGVRSLESILDMVKVMSFALQEGKTAVHCHAGLGRTGVLIACYLIYAERLGAEEAIHVMRKNRPKAVQTRGQIECVKDFCKFLNHLWIVFPSCQPGFKRFTLQHYLTRQKHILHGMEARQLKNLPKIICITCSRLLELASVKAEDKDIKWGLPVEVKEFFSEPEEEASSATDGTLPTVPPREENLVPPDTPTTELKHNPYVESDIGALQRSQILGDAADGDDDDEVRHICAPVGSRMSAVIGLTQRSRAHSDPDIYKQLGRCSLRVDGITTPPPTLPGGIHGIRLEPLDLSKLKANDKKNIFKPVDEDEDKVDADLDRDINDASTFLEASTSPQEEDTQAPSDSEVDRDMVARALGARACADAGVQNKTEKLKRKLNTSDSGWEEVRNECDPWVLSRLLWTWLEDLEEPVLSESDVDQLSEGTDDPVSVVKRLKKKEKGLDTRMPSHRKRLLLIPYYTREQHVGGNWEHDAECTKGVRDTFECLVTTVLELEPLSDELEDRVLRRLAMVLTHDRKLPLTSTRASLDRMASTSSSGGTDEAAVDEQNNSEGEVEANGDGDSVTTSRSYRLLLVLRKLIRTVSGQSLDKS